MSPFHSQAEATGEKWMGQVDGRAVPFKVELEELPQTLHLNGIYLI